MQAALRQHSCRLGVCVAIFAKVTAGVVRADIAGKIAGAFGSCAFLFRRVQMLPDRLFVVADPHDPETGEANNYDGDDGFDGMFRFEKRMK